MNGTPFRPDIQEHLETKIDKIAAACFTSKQSIVNFLLDLQLKNMDVNLFVENIRKAMLQSNPKARKCQVENKNP